MRTRRWIRQAVAPLALASLLTGCRMEGLQSVMEPAGPIAAQQRDLFMWTYYLSWFVMLLVAGVLIYAIVRYRRTRYPKDDIPDQVHGHTGLEIAWTVLPVLIVIAVAVPTVRTIFTTENRVEIGGDDLVVNVTGYQWWWRFEYPEQGIVTANELHVPAGRRVVLNLDSADVLHSFWAPRIAGKRDMIPNQNNQLWFTVDESGTYYGQCAELCLGAHAYMRFRIIAETEEEFEGWVQSFEEVGTREVQADEQVQRGRELFATKGCTNCHTIDGYREGARVGDPDFPNLTNFGLRTSLAAGVLDNDQENLERWLRDPQQVKPGNYMPTLWDQNDPDADEEIAAVAAYLLSLGADAEEQALATKGAEHGDR